MGENEFRWELAGSELQPALFEAAASIEPRRELVQVEYLHVQARTIISRVPNASQMPFAFTINAYRGCTHACTYCFARPTHTYLGMDGGEDFERRIVVKVNAAERLRSELAHPRWEGEHIAMGTNTDPYQPCEGRYRLTRSIVEVLGEAANPFSILTKSPMIVRDLDALCAAAERAEVHANFSVGTLDRDVWRASEPGTPPPERRIEAMARLNEAGIPTGVLIGPVIPGMSDDEAGLERVVRGGRRGGRRLDRADPAAPAPRRARALHALARARAARPAAALRGALPRARRLRAARGPAAPLGHRAAARGQARRHRGRAAALARHPRAAAAGAAAQPGRLTPGRGCLG